MVADHIADEPQNRRGPGRPARLGRDAILDAAASLPADELTLKAVAENLGVSPPAIYHWFADKQAVIAALGERALESIELPDPELPWDNWVRTMATRGRAALLTTPLTPGHLGAAPFRRAGMRHADAALGVFIRDGFTTLEAVRAMEMITRYIFMSALVETATAQGPGAHRVAPADIAADFDPTDYPNLVAAAPVLMNVDPAADFSDGLETLIAGVSARRES